MEFGEFLKRRRSKLGLSQTDIAQAISYSPQVISKWEKGASFPTIDVIKPLAKELKINLSDFLNFDSDAPQTDSPIPDFDVLYFSNQLRYRRIENHLTQKELGNQVQLNQQTIIKLESQKSVPDINTFKKFAQILNVFPEDLYKKPEETTQNEKAKTYDKIKTAKQIRTIAILCLVVLLIGYIIWLSIESSRTEWFIY
jgi:transcriptional regulator with XRE-family HTH domain